MRFPRPVLVVLAVGLAVHLASAILVGVFNPNFISPESDQYGYRVLAQNLLDHGSFSMVPPPDNDPMLLRTPGYPVLLAGLYAFDRSGLLVILMQQLMLVASAAVMYLLMRRFNVGQFVALGLLVFMLVEPQQWLYSLQTMTEAPALFLVALALALALLWTSPALWRATCIGVFLGLMPLMKPNLLFFLPPIALLYILTVDAPIRRKVILGGVATLVALAVIAPWLVRNYTIVGAPILSSSPAVNLVVGFGTLEESTLVSTGVPLDGVCCRLPYWDASVYPELTALGSGIIKREGLPRLLWKQVVYAPRVYFDREFYVTLAKIAGLHSGFVAYAVNALQGVLLALMIAGLFILSKKARIIQACLFVLMLTGILVLNAQISYSRMLIPLYPVFAILAGIGLTALISRFQSKQFY